MNDTSTFHEQGHVHTMLDTGAAGPFDRSRVAHIAGWGVDLDKADRPACPMERRPPRLPTEAQREPVPQASSVEVLHSTERPGLTPVYGTTSPPRGVSGAIRRVAFRFSENDLRHWLTLLFADRVDMAEGLVSDLAHGHVPNVLAEMGARAEWQHNPRGAVKKAAAVAAGVAVAYWLLKRRRRLR